MKLKGKIDGMHKCNRNVVFERRYLKGIFIYVMYDVIKTFCRKASSKRNFQTLLFVEEREMQIANRAEIILVLLC